MRILIIDDESKARSSLRQMLQLFCPDVEVIGEADGVRSGQQLIKEQTADLVFLDIEMQDGTGLDLLRQLGKVDFQVVFVTAYNQYAVEAFRLSAIDYLLKPIQPERLVESVNRARKNGRVQTGIGTLLENMQIQTKQDRKVVLKDADSLYVIQIKDILHCQADGGYTHFIIQGQKTITTSINLKEYEKLFGDFGFIRCHHSHLVNLQHIIRFDKADGGQLVLSDHSKVPVSFRKKEKLLKSLQAISENLF
ncbi:MAG: LytTR family DNA-binding domain-containing protein [Saprospiraceae bacterium]